MNTLQGLRVTVAAIVLASTVAAPAAEPVKIGMVTTLSTGAGYLGEDVRDGFLLAVSQEDGKLGGVAVDVMVEDDSLKPGNGKQIAARMVKRDGARIMTGIIFSNVAMAVVPGLLRDGITYVSPNAGPSPLAGKGCNANYFVVSWQNDNLHEAPGQYAQDAGYASAFILAPNYQAGKDALTGFKRYFKGEIVGELYTKLGQTDYSAEIAQIRAAGPAMVFQFLPGGMGINFLKQYAQAGLKQKIPLVLSGVSIDERIIGALGEVVEGIVNPSFWAPTLDNAANRQFVAAFKKAYGRTPTAYAAQGYDTARAIGSALAAVGGDTSDMNAFRAALREAKFDSVRGNFRFGRSQHPVQDWFVRVVEKQADGTFVNRVTGQKVFTAHGNPYEAECGL